MIVNKWNNEKVINPLLVTLRVAQFYFYLTRKPYGHGGRSMVNKTCASAGTVTSNGRRDQKQGFIHKLKYFTMTIFK